MRELFNPELLTQLLTLDLSSQNTSEINTTRIESLKASILKKYVPTQAANLSLDKQAKLDFISRNERVSLFEADFKSLPFLVSARVKLYDMFHSDAYQSNVLTLNQMASKGLPGPGSSRGTRHTDFVNKMFNSDLTCTNLMLYKHYYSSLPERWRQAEDIRSTRHTIKVVNGSSLSSVPKDASRNRIICTEPSLNMFYQLGAKVIIEDLLKKYYRFDISSQPSINKNLACFGSMTGKVATIDLKDASDMISLKLVEYLLPYNVFHALMCVRSHTAQCDDQELNLSMMSTMGNGFTFPLMTLLLYVLMEAYIEGQGGRLTYYREAVFGDDIIISSRYYDGFCAFLESLGLVVNHSKSFSTGSFRESCGGDYYNGHDVRGVYIKRMKYESDVYSAFNRLFAWSSKYNIDLSRSLHYLFGISRKRYFVPFDESDDAGFKIPRDLATGVSTDKNGATYYRCIATLKRKYFFSGSYPNPFGAFIGAIGGYVTSDRPKIRAGTVVTGQYTIVRSRDPAYRVIRKITPSWDFLPSSHYDYVRNGVAHLNWQAIFSLLE